jgi:hypothetical protein
MLELGVMV